VLILLSNLILVFGRGSCHALRQTNIGTGYDAFIPELDVNYRGKFEGANFQIAQDARHREMKLIAAITTYSMKRKICCF
jgi:hypothetical protein